jgi:cellulose synthase operon protein C
LRTAADLLARDPANPQVLGVLDALYTGLCDEATGEPNPFPMGAEVRRITITLHNALSAGSESPLAFEVFGKFALAGGYNDMAVTALPRAEGLGVPADRVDIPLGLAFLRLGRYQDVLSTTQREGETSWHRAELLSLQARAYLGLARLPEARQAFSAALAIDPGNVDALSRLGMLALWQDRDSAAASALLARARQTAPEAVPTLRLAGEYDYATGDYRGSAAAYDALVRRGAPETFDPTPPSLGLARALTYAGDLAAARAALGASRLPAYDASLRYYRAVLAYRAGEFRNATDLAQSLDAALPNYPPLELLLGGASLASGFPATAVTHLGRYVAEVPDDVSAQHLLLLAQRGMTDPHSATVPRQELLAAFGFPQSSGLSSRGKDGS